MNKIDRERQKGLEALQNATKQSFAFLKMDKDGKCQECYLIGLHKDTDLALFEQQAIAYKAEKEALEAEKQAEYDRIEKEAQKSQKASILRLEYENAYLLMKMDIAFGKIEAPDDLDDIDDWFKKYKKKETENIYDSQVLKTYLSMGVEQQ